MARSTILFLAATEDPDADVTALSARLASTRYRATIPYHAIRARGRLVDIAAIGRALSRTFTVGTIVVPQIKESTLRSAPGVAPALLDFVARHRASGTRIVLDVTDLKLGPDYEAARTAELGAAGVRSVARFFHDLANAVDAVTASSTALADALRRLLPGRTIAVVPDPAELAEGVVAFAPGPTLRLAWFGLSGPHRVALDRLIRHDLPRIARIRNADLTIVSDALPPGTADASIRLVRWSVETLARILARTDLVLLPVDLASPLDRLKSGNRMIQAVRAGRIAVAHPLPAYRELAAYGWVGDDLVDGVGWALANPGAARGRVAAGQAFVRSHATPAAIADAWLAVVDQLEQKGDHRFIG